ncbi:isoleucine--tRNA ligase [Candidatus Woesearchaeota archaeon]|nr:isoleucine--tRNA ligase [Candidatus Woesearchaeota archaeon]
MEKKEFSKKYSFESIEEDVLTFWRAHKKEIDIAIKDENTTDKERYTFLEGPPTANAPPGLHHVEARVYKDLITRFKTMQGYKVSRKGGWDCHGLPVEVQVEKKLGLEDKKDVLKYGVEPFIEECKNDVFTFIKDWEHVTEKLAYWVDLQKPYRTLDTDYMESIWWALSEIYKKDLLYLGHKIVPYCSRCGTPLSSHEVAQGYKDVEDTTVVVTFPVVNQESIKKLANIKSEKTVTFLAWTTTPWTLPSNLALAVHPKVNYQFVESEKEIYVLAEDLVSKYFEEDDRKILGSVLGKDLVGQKYVPLFDYFKDVATNSFRVIPADYVTTEDGTGIVHQAPAYGEDDNVVCKDNDIDFVNPVDDNGEFTDEVPDFKGLFVKDADSKIIEMLDSTGRLFTTSPYVHSYPFCWRCNTPLIYYAKDTWFIKVSAIKDKLLEHNETINWFPNNIKQGRFGNWLEGARDWALSRNKFWGTPLPIWICNGPDSEDGEQTGCGHQEVIGSIAELKEKSGVQVDDLHLGTVNKVHYKCSECGGQMSRTSEVIDCWFDSGSAPFAQFHYPFENKDLFEQSFPYDFISEAIDQTRGWFYTMLVINTILFDKSPYKNVAVAGLIGDENGEKMSKSKGNMIKPLETFAEVGVDGVRLAMTSYALGNAIKYGPSIFKEQINPFFTTLWNSFLYVQNYMDRFNLTGFEVHDAVELEDEWMISKTNSMIDVVTSHLDVHEYNHAMNTLMDFVNNTFSRTYIKLIRERTNDVDKELAYVFRFVLDATVKVLAPFAPYVTEYIYQNFLKTDDSPWSVHFDSWPKVGYRNLDLEREFEDAQTIIQGILAAREKAKQGVRWPLSNVKVLSEKITSLQKNILDLVKSQTNVKEIEFVSSFDVKLEFEIDYKLLGGEFGTETGDVIPAVKKNMDLVTKTLNQSDSVVIDKWVLHRDLFKITKVVPSPYVMAPFTNGEVYLDTTVTSELESEGFARELTRRIQNLRKVAGLQKEDSIKLSVTGDLGDIIEKYSSLICDKVGTDSILSSGSFEFTSEEKVKGRTFVISLEKN